MDNPATLLNAELDAIAVPVPLAMGEILFQAGDPGEGAYVVRTGRVALTLSDNGKVYQMGALGPKSILGLPAVLNGSYSLSAMALEDSTFGYIPNSRVVDLLNYFPRLLSEASKMLAQELARVRPMITGTGDSHSSTEKRNDIRVSNQVMAVSPMLNTEPMQSHPRTDRANGLSTQLSALSRMQYEALLVSPYVNMSPQAAAEYGRRRVRIGEICDLLAKYRA